MDCGDDSGLLDHSISLRHFRLPVLISEPDPLKVISFGGGFRDFRESKNVPPHFGFVSY